MIEAQQLAEVAAYLELQWRGYASVAALRDKLPGLHFAYCLEDEIGADEPVYEASSFNLYLIDSSQHCMSLTPDIGLATGILIAELGEE